jgi:o-succinylbenzoate---CoA ligase
MTDRLFSQAQFAGWIRRDRLIHPAASTLLDLIADRQTQLIAQPPGRLLLLDLDPLNSLATIAASLNSGRDIILGNPTWTQTEQSEATRITTPTLTLSGKGEWHSPPQPPQSPNPPTQTPIIAIATGGTSGKLRFARHTWQTLTTAAAAQTTDLGPIHSICTLPLHHVSGLMQLIRSLLTDGTWQPIAFRDLLNQGLPPQSDRSLSLVPTQLQRLLTAETDWPIADRITWLQQLKVIWLGGAAAWPSLLAEARRLELPIAPTYGMTETAAMVTRLTPEDFLAGYSGCGSALPHCNISIQSDHKYGSKNDGLIGKITIESPSLCLGYWPEEGLEQAIKPGSFVTDDLGYIDDRGSLHIVGRSSDKIISGGENIFASEVETAIRDSGLVADVAVVGIPDDRWGEIVVALYQPIDLIHDQQKYTDQSPPELGDLGGDAGTIAASLNQTLARYKHPKNWISVAELPRNSQGKINRLVLVQMAIDRVMPD